MSRSITIRDVPDATCDELRARAAAQGRSLQAYLRRRLIDLADRPDAEELLRKIAQRKAQAGSRLSAADILGFRDADRR